MLNKILAITFVSLISAISLAQSSDFESRVCRIYNETGTSLATVRNGELLLQIYRGDDGALYLNEKVNNTTLPFAKSFHRGVYEQREQQGFSYKLKQTGYQDFVLTLRRPSLSKDPQFRATGPLCVELTQPGRVEDLYDLLSGS